MIVGIVGGKSDITQSVAQQLKKVSPYHLAEFTMAEPEGGRMNTPVQRLKVLKQLTQPAGKSVIVVNCIHFEEEAEYIRKKKGFIFHIKGAMSAYISMKPNDLLVTHRYMIEGNYQPVAEALHECRIRKHSENGMPEPSVRWLE